MQADARSLPIVVAAAVLLFNWRGFSHFSWSWQFALLGLFFLILQLFSSCSFFSFPNLEFCKKVERKEKKKKKVHKTFDWCNKLILDFFLSLF
jgi:hypothetical protein